MRVCLADQEFEILNGGELETLSSDEGTAIPGMDIPKIASRAMAQFQWLGWRGMGLSPQISNQEAERRAFLESLCDRLHNEAPDSAIGAFYSLISRSCTESKTDDRWQCYREAALYLYDSWNGEGKEHLDEVVCKTAQNILWTSVGLCYWYRIESFHSVFLRPIGVADRTQVVAYSAIDVFGHDETWENPSPDWDVKTGEVDRKGRVYDMKTLMHYQNGWFLVHGQYSPPTRAEIEMLLSKHLL